MSWDDPDILRADLVILRATADYADRLDEFLAWTRRVRNLLNPPDVVAWNVDKSYLRDLASAGVPLLVDPTTSDRPVPPHWSFSVARSHTPSPRSGWSSRTSSSGTWVTPPCVRPPIASASAQASCCTPVSM